MAIWMIFSMISVHGLMLIIWLQMIRKADGRTKIKSNRIFILGIVLIGIISQFFSLSYWDNGLDSGLSWYNIVNGSTNLAILNTLFYGAWILAALYRNMRAELQFSDKPIWWFAFILANLFFQFGYLYGVEKFSPLISFNLTLGMLFFQTLSLVYFLALTEPKDIVNFRYLIHSLSIRNYDSFLRQVPLWLITLPISFMIGIIVVTLFSIIPGTAATKQIFADFSIQNSLSLVLILIAVFSFVVRDLGVLLLLNFSSRPKRADAVMIIYLLLVYVLLPMLAKNLPILGIFYPDIKANPVVMIAFPFIEMSIVFYFLRQRWDAIKASNNTAF